MGYIKPANAQLIKGLNQQLVLNMIKKEGAISGADLAKITRLQPATVSKILKHINDLGMIREAGIGESTKLGGKRPNLWRLNADFGYVIGVEVLSFELRAVLLDFESKVVAEHSESLPKKITSENIADHIHALVRTVCNAGRIAMKNLMGVALGVSGIVDSEDGAIKFSIDLGLREHPIRDILEKRLNTQVVVDNDANAAAVGTKWMGCGQDKRHLVYLIVNERITGIGCGIILNDELFRGTTNSAGELTLSLPALDDLRHDEASSENGKPATSLTMTNLIAMAREGDDNARQTLVDLANVLAEEVARILDFINPELVVFGGDIVEAADLILEPIRSEVKKLTLELPFKAVTIKMTGFGQNAVAIGAASLIFKQVFKKTQSAARHVFAIPGTKRNKPVGFSD